MNTKFLLRAVIVSALSIANPVHGSSRPTSIIVVPVFVPIEVLRGALEAQLPADHRDSGRRRTGVPLFDVYEYSLNISRSPINLSGADGSLIAVTSLRGHANLKINPNTPFPIPTDGQVLGDVTLRLRPQLSSAWRLDASPELTARVQEVRGLLANVARAIGTDVRQMAQASANYALEALSRELRDQILANDFIEVAARQFWSDVCGSHRVASIEAGGIDLWIVVRPIAFHAAQPVIDSRGMTLTLGLEADTKLVTEAQTQECGSLPPLRLNEAQHGLSLIVPVELEYGALSRTLAQQFVGKAIPVANGALTLTPRDVRLAGEDASLNVVVEVDVAWHRWWAWWSWLFGPTRASVELTTEPALAGDEQVLSFRNTRISAQSDDALNVVGNLARLAQGALVGAFEQAAIINLSPEAERARENAARAAASIDTEGLGGLVVETAKVDAPRLVSLVLGPQALTLMMVATGDLRLAIHEIPIQP